KLNVMTRVSFVNRGDVGSIIIEGGEPFLFLLFRPVVLGRRDVVVGLVGAFLEWTGCVHRSKGGGTEILRRLLHLCTNVRGDIDQMLVQNVFTNLVQVFGYIWDEILRRGMFAL